MVSSEMAHIWDAFRTPAQRELADKERRGLETAEPFSVPHGQVLEWPLHDRPVIELVGYRWPAHASGTHPPRRALLVHGWEWQAGRMLPFVEPLRTAGYEVIGYDGPAHGASGGTMTTLLDYAEAIRSVAEHLGGVQAVIGHSFGGMAAAWLLGHSRLSGIVRFVSISAGGDVEFLINSSGRFQGADEAVKQAFRGEFKRRMGAFPIDFDAVAGARAITIPTLIVHDTRDQMVPVHFGQAFAAAIPGARLHLTTGLGHRFILRDAETVKLIVDFVVNTTHG
jgi:pimeloyl-ACP methyl ester carboxylesterase